jgi:F0F1-type ATP synthase assembly protein I
MRRFQLVSLYLAAGFFAAVLAGALAGALAADAVSTSALSMIV